MSAVAAPSVFSGSANIIAVGVLLAEFGMFRQALLRDQVRLYAAQSALISVLAIVVAAARHLPDLADTAAPGTGQLLVRPALRFCGSALRRTAAAQCAGRGKPYRKVRSG